MESERRYYVYLDSMCLGLFTSERTPQIGEYVKVEVSDGEFEEYVISSIHYQAGEVPEFYLCYPSEHRNMEIRRATIDG